MKSLLCFFIAACSFVSVFGESQIPIVSFNGKLPVYDKANKYFLLPVPPAYATTTAGYPARISYGQEDASMQVLIDGVAVSSGSLYTFRNVGGEKKYSLTVLTANGGMNLPLYLTFLPVVEMKGSTFNQNSYNNGTICVNDGDHLWVDSLYQMKARYRGATAANKQKKSFAVKLTDAQGKSIDRSFFGLRSDNNWILDAMAVDPGRMRNRVSTDIWNDYAEKPYYASKEPKALSGTRGRFVELFLEGQYQGLYCMTEKLDRKQLRLKQYGHASAVGKPDTIHGVLYKAMQWGYEVQMGYENNSYPRHALSSYNNNSDKWANWELKYPDLDDSEKIDWKPLYSAINSVATYTEADFLSNVGKYFDLPVLRDYYLLVELILATDNSGKNMYWFTYDMQKYPMISLAPWDLDGTWGRSWSGAWHTEITSTSNYYNFRGYWHTLFQRLRASNYNGWNENLARRYRELRENVFSPDNLLKRFTDYRALFTRSGAEAREIRRWQGVDGITMNFDTEMNYLASWIPQRIAALDAAYSYVSGVSQVAASLQVSGGKGYLWLRASSPTAYTVADLSGRVIREGQADILDMRIDGLPAGIYLVNKQKVLVR